ncbi:MAG: hypothetical protein QM764_22325 [Chitinophagaceae bacterium]
MKHKTIIAIWGAASQGKTSSVVAIASRIRLAYPAAGIHYLHQGVEIKAIVTIGKIKVGIESQGDPPGLRMKQSLDDFHTAGCSIIICTCRTRGVTEEYINQMNYNYGYHIIWTSNYFSNEKPAAHLNQRFADHILVLVDDLLKGII